MPTVIATHDPQDGIDFSDTFGVAVNGDYAYYLYHTSGVEVGCIKVRIRNGTMNIGALVGNMVSYRVSNVYDPGSGIKVKSDASYVYVGDEYGLYILNASDLSLVGVGSSVPNGDPHFGRPFFQYLELDKSENYVYGSGSGESFVTFDVQIPAVPVGYNYDPSPPIVEGEYLVYDPNQNTAIMVDDGAMLYRAIDVSVPTTPSEIAFVNTLFQGTESYSGCALSGTLAAFGTDYGDEVKIVDISNHAVPSVLSTYVGTLDTVTCIRFVGNHLVLAGRGTVDPGVTLTFLDISNPAAPVLETTFEVNEFPLRDLGYYQAFFEIYESQYIVLSCSASGYLAIIDASDILEPPIPGTIPPINDIVFYEEEYCESCDNKSKNHGMIVLDANTSFVAQFGITQNGGATWSLINSPFDVSQNIMSVVVFELDKNVKRWLIAREDDGADVIEVAYSDDYGTTWTIVEVSSDVGGAIDSGALFAINKNNIWLGVNDGRIFFSANGGEDWTEQTTPITEDIHAIHFADTSYGFAVASNGQVIKTKDGGSTWIKVTDISGTPNVNCVHCFNEFRAIVGTENGYIYITFNGGDTWIAKKSIDGKITDISFSDDFVGYASATLSYTPTKGRILRTINGGQDWESLYTPLCENLNALDIVSTNTAWFVGDEAGAAFIIKASG